MLEHFKNVLNRPEPDLSFEGIEQQDELDRKETLEILTTGEA